MTVKLLGAILCVVGAFLIGFQLPEIIDEDAQPSLCLGTGLGCAILMTGLLLLGKV